MCRPKTARLVSREYPTTSAASSTSTHGRFLNRASATMMNMTTSAASEIFMTKIGNGSTAWP